jgi:hypothetical protein
MAPGAGGELAAEQIAGASTAFDDLDEGAVR